MYVGGTTAHVSSPPTPAPPPRSRPHLPCLPARLAPELARLAPRELLVSEAREADLAMLVSDAGAAPRLVILDEPTAALGVAQTEQVLNLVRRLADSGVAVIIISHNLVDVFKVCDDIAVLYLGRMVAQIETKNTNQADVVGYITGTKNYDGAN